MFAAYAGPALAVEPFIAPPVPSGNLTVQLVPTEVVTPGSIRLVTFGVPFPRGSITAAGLSSVRVFKGGVEIPAHVAEMTPWRHRINPGLDGTSVRVARVQIQTEFAGSAAESISVSWGGAPRVLDVPTLTPVRNGWHTVTSGSYVAADWAGTGVYAVLPKHGSASAVKAPQHPIRRQQSEPRDTRRRMRDPAWGRYPKKTRGEDNF